MKKKKIVIWSGLGLLLLYFALEYVLFIQSSYRCSNCSEVLIIHFMHGYYPKKYCDNQKQTVGGLLGGHIELELDSFVYGFEYREREDIHFFSHKVPADFNSRFTRKTGAAWQQETLSERITSIAIPITATQKQTLLTTLDTYRQQAPYDYAFLGMRCASVAYELLATADILPKRSRPVYIFNAFYPRQLRVRMLPWATHNALEIDTKAGIDCRVWE